MDSNRSTMEIESGFCGMKAYATKSLSSHSNTTWRSLKGTGSRYGFQKLWQSLTDLGLNKRRGSFVNLLKGEFLADNMNGTPDSLKVPKCEIFDRSDFPDFYTIKSSWVGDLVVKILMRMLRVCISSWCVCSACFKGTALCSCISTWCICSVHAPVPDSYAQCTHQFLTRTLSMRTSSWREWSAYT